MVMNLRNAPGIGVVVVHDVVIVGAGPGGLQAGIAAASEGLDVLILEADKVGGQIGQTPKLENFCFANGGITGPEVARMMREQAKRMGCRIEAGRAIKLHAGLDSLKVGVGVPLVSVSYINARTVVLAMGNRWMDLDIPGIKEGVAARTVHYGPVDCLSSNVAGEAVAVCGGGPSGGQAIIELAGRARWVHVIVRSALKMPLYLIERIQALPNVTIHTGKIESVASSTWGERRAVVVLENGEALEVADLFMCAGLKPATEWLVGTPGIQLDPDGRVITALPSLQTGLHNVYAIGDCRAGSTPRVGVAIGDGSLVVTELWRKFVKTRDCHSCATILG